MSENNGLIKGHHINKPERSEEDVLCQTITLRLAGEDHEVPVRSIKANREFRRRLGEIVSCLAQQPGEDQMRAIWRATFENADLLMELPVVYAPQLSEYCKRATDDELLAAGTRIVEVSLPLVQQMISLMGAINAGLEG